MPMCGYDQTHMCFKTKCYKIRKIWAINHFMFRTSSDRSKAVLLLSILFVIYASRLSFLFCFVCSLQPCDHILGEGSPLGSHVYEVSLCFCHFPIGVSGQV